jgi:hypothetical protein
MVGVDVKVGVIVLVEVNVLVKVGEGPATVAVLVGESV